MRTKSYISREKFAHVYLREERQPLLSRLDMEITERCNNNCIHCYINLPANNQDAKRREISADEIRGILKEAASLGCLVVKFTGGEPLLRDDFQELYIFARKIGLKVIIFTNATLITPRHAELFTRIPPLEKIEVTVYGMKKESYEKITGVPGSFEAAWRGINLLLEYKVPFRVKGALLSHNKDEIDEFESWAAATFGPDRPLPYAMFFDLRARRDEEKNSLIKSIRATSDDIIKILSRKKSKYLSENKEFCLKLARPCDDKIFTCNLGVRFGSVDAYGKFQLCMLLRHPDTVYDLKNGSLKDALTNFFPKIRDIKTANPDYLKRCACCFLKKGFCEQCPAKSWMECGTLDTPVEYHCEIAHARARALGLLKEDEKAWEIEGWGERIKKFVESK